MFFIYVESTDKINAWDVQPFSNGASSYQIEKKWTTNPIYWQKTIITQLFVRVSGKNLFGSEKTDSVGILDLCFMLIMAVKAANQSLMAFDCDVGTEKINDDFVQGDKKKRQHHYISDR